MLGEMVRMKTVVLEWLEDFLYCVKLSIKLSIIPILIGLVITTLYCLFTGNQITVYYLLRGIRSAGMIISSAGLFICAGAFLKPNTLAPLSYQNQWRIYFVRFNLIGAILCICTLVLFYFLMMDLALWYVYFA